MVDLNSLVSETCRAHNFNNLKPEDVRSISFSCRVAGIPSQIDTPYVSQAVDVILAAANSCLSHRNSFNPLTASIVTASMADSCPICKSRMKMVKLVGGRQATFCPQHNVVLPLSVSQ